MRGRSRASRATHGCWAWVHLSLLPTPGPRPPAQCRVVREVAGRMVVNKPRLRVRFLLCRFSWCHPKDVTGLL